MGFSLSPLPLCHSSPHICCCNIINANQGNSHTQLVQQLSYAGAYTHFYKCCHIFTGIVSPTFSISLSSPPVVFAIGESNVRQTARAVAPGTLYQFSGTPLLPIGQLLSKEFTTQPTRHKVSLQLQCTQTWNCGARRFSNAGFSFIFQSRSCQRPILVQSGAHLLMNR